MERQFEELKESYHWESIPSGVRVVDVGGGSGHMAIALARVSYPVRHGMRDLTLTVESKPRNYCPRFVGDASSGI